MEQTTFTHSPAPWCAKPDNKIPGMVSEYEIRTARGLTIAYVEWQSDATFAADASLIAAAPEMLAALRDIATILATMPATDQASAECHRLALDAIAKAEGF